MRNWWESDHDVATANIPARIRAVAYYRHSAQDRQENSIPIQRDQVREWADKNGVEIIEEFADAGKSGLTSEGRPEFTRMMREWVEQRRDFDYILCLDVSRWGRFQDIDLSAQFSATCRKHGKQVIYTSIGKPREDDPLYPVYVQFERFRAAQYSRELSDKVWRGCVKISEQGYWAGGQPPFAMRRLLLDEKREPVQVLEPGQRKGIQNQRVTLVPGDETQVAIIRRIFHEFVELGYSEHRIAEGLNGEGILSPSGRRWGAGGILHRLCNETYIGTLRYNRTTQKLKTPRRDNPPEKWVRTPEAFEGIVTVEEFERAQEILLARRRKYEPAELLARLKALIGEYGIFRQSLLRDGDAPPPAAYRREFGSWDQAFQALYAATRDRVREQVAAQIRLSIGEVLNHSDFLVLDRKLSLSIQPLVPVPHGYDTYWPVRIDERRTVDLTLGVLLSEPDECEILGYIAVPRWLAEGDAWRLRTDATRLELFGRENLDFLRYLV